MESPKTLPVRLGWRLPRTPTPHLTFALRILWFPHVRRPICSHLPPLIAPPNRIDLLEAVMNPTRHIELDIDIGADARDWSAIQAQEKLKPVELELRRVEEMVGEIVTEMDYLRMREQKLRDTNESTNERVKWFAFGTMGMLVGLGAWQVVYLRAYFRWVFIALDLLLSFMRRILLTSFGLQVKAFDLIADGFDGLGGWIIAVKFCPHCISHISCFLSTLISCRKKSKLDISCTFGQLDNDHERGCHKRYATSRPLANKNLRRFPLDLQSCLPTMIFIAPCLPLYLSSNLSTV